MKTIKSWLGKVRLDKVRSGLDKIALIPDCTGVTL